MELSYQEAVQRVREEAQKASCTEKCSIFVASDRVVGETLCSPKSTPEYDTSAMDGYALSSRATERASKDSPAFFTVTATTAAGDKPYKNSSKSAIPPCVEIMTGAPFPEDDQFDCCVPIEHVVKDKHISVLKPAQRFQHRRFAGGDFHEGDAIIHARQRIQPKHIMALASVGFTEVPVLRRPRIAVFSTGSELKSGGLTHAHTIHDANGPYLTAMLRQWADVDFKGVIRDDYEEMREAITAAEYDIIVTSGAVSAGRCDLIPGLVQGIGGRTVFHKVAIKPGHPVFLSMLPSQKAFFGLPGNPVAAAACARFFVVPYIKAAQQQAPERPHYAHLQGDKCFRKEPDVFRPAVLTDQQVEIVHDHSPGKTKPFLGANCWVHVPGGVSELEKNSQIGIYSL